MSILAGLQVAQDYSGPNNVMPHCLLACTLMTATPQWLAKKDWFSARVWFVCLCLSMSVYVCEWCTLSHYAALARTSPKQFPLWFYLTTINV